MSFNLTMTHSQDFLNHLTQKFYSRETMAPQHPIPTPSPWLPWWTCLFGIPCEMLWLFCIWLIALSMLFLGLTYVELCTCILSFFRSEYYATVCALYILFIHPSVGRHLCHFQHLAVENNVAMNPEESKYYSGPRFQFLGGSTEKGNCWIAQYFC